MPWENSRLIKRYEIIPASISLLEEVTTLQMTNIKENFLGANYKDFVLLFTVYTKYRNAF